MVKLQAFSDFWMNCWFNANFSIITSIDSSYIDAAYLNSYMYYLEEYTTPINTDINILRIDLSKDQFEFMSKIVHTVPFMFDESKTVVSQVLDLLKHNYLFLGVGLYNWIPNSICWQKHHWSHYSLIKEYNPHKDAFIVLDEDYNGYGVHEIPRYRFEEAVMNSDLKCDGLCDGMIVNYNKNINKYEIDYTIVKNNAKRLLNELAAMFDDCWMLTSKDVEEGHMLDLFSMYCFGIASRHMANILLIQRLVYHNYINKSRSDELLTLFFELKIGWGALKNKFLRASLSSTRKLDVVELNILKNTLISKEMKAWKIIVA